MIRRFARRRRGSERVAARPKGRPGWLRAPAVLPGAALAACLTASACTSSPAGPPPPAPAVPAGLVIAAGNGQSGTLGSALDTAPAVRVSDAAGGGVAGIVVRFTVVAGGGGVERPSAVTDAQGRASPGSWTLGDEPGTQRLRAEASGVAAVEFTATATAGAGGEGSGSTGNGSGFAIEVRYNAESSPSPAQAAAFAGAVERWQRIIVGDLPDVTLRRPAGTCTSSTPIEETVDDLVILVTLESIDGPGGVLGSAGPCIVRHGTLLPIVGRMRFDTADLSNLEASGLLDEVVLHEMGHVLGIGTLWDNVGLLADPAAEGGADPHFTGSGAVSGFEAIGGSGYAGARVPVEATGGPGTRDAHWRESVFDRELMTGWLDAGANPLSLVTIRALGDLAYAVDEGAAEGVSLAISPSFVPRPGAGRDGLSLGPDLILVPLDVVSTSGRRVGIIPR